MSTLYIAHTPYHVIQANGLASESDEPRSDQNLVGILDADMERLLRSLRAADDTPFGSIRTMPGAYGLTSDSEHTTPRSHLRAKYNTLKLRRFVDRHDVDRVYSFNDYRPEDQAAFDAVTRRSSGGDSRRIYAEDGTSAYLYQERNWDWFDTLKLRLLYGRWWTKIPQHGASKWIDEIRVSFPEQARPELRDLPISELPRREVLSLADRSWFRRYVEETGVGGDLDSLDGVVFVSHPDGLAHLDTYVETIQRLVDRLADRGYRLGVKYHPRETVERLDTSRSDVVTLPSDVPAEVLFIASPDMEFVVGNHSTALLSAPWLLADATIISLIRVFETNYPRLASVFEELGLVLPETYSTVSVPEV